VAVVVNRVDRLVPISVTATTMAPAIKAIISPYSTMNNTLRLTPLDVGLK